MKNVIFWLALSFGILGVNYPVSASFQEALDLYNAGKFELAVAKGRNAHTADGLALAVRGQLVLIQYIFEEGDRTNAINRAIEDGEAALAMDPENQEAILNLGIIYGLRAKYETSISDGKKSRGLLKMAHKNSPNNSWALGALASWHAETIYQVGRIPAWAIFGADRKKAFSLFAKAIEAGPDNLTIRAAYIRALLKIGDKKHKKLAASQIDYVLGAKPVNVLEQLMVNQVWQIKTALDLKDKGELELLLDEIKVPKVQQAPAG